MWALLLGALIIVSITHWVFRWRSPSCNGKLPPGSMGLPLLGETLHFMSSYTSSDIQPFVKKRMERYGPIFKTSLIGQSVVVSTDSDLNYFIFQKEGQLFQSWYPASYAKIFGNQSVSIHGILHKYLKNMVLNLFGHEGLKKMLPEVEQTTFRTLQQWSCQDSVELKEAIQTMIFDFSAKKLISYDSTKSSENLRNNFAAFMRGIFSLPLDIPGTAFHKSLEGRKSAMKLLKKLLHERREMNKKQQTDFFDFVIEEIGKEGTILTEEIVLDLIFSLLFASFETTSLTLTYAMKLLTDHPMVLKQLQEEHEVILKRREDPNSGVTWQEYKSMRFTIQFINETLRLANITPGIFRKTLRDFNFKGYTIPAGWAIMVCPPAVHLNPENFQDPLTFNPWRWEEKELGPSKNFMAFGGGMRFCVGADFAKVEMAVFLHKLVTGYRWRLIKGGNTIRTPVLQFPNDFHVQIIKKDQSKQEPEYTITN